MRRVDKWPQAGGLLINCSSLHSSALSMSTHAPRTDIHLAISNLKSRQCVFIRVRWGGGRCWYTGGQGGNLVEFHNKSPTAHSLHLTRRKENFGTGNEKYVGIMCSLRRLWLRCITQRVNKSREKKVSFSQRRVKSWKLSGQRGNSRK